MKKLLAILFVCVGMLACNKTDVDEMEMGNLLSDTLRVGTNNTVVDTVLITKATANYASGIFDIIYKRDWENNPEGLYTYNQMKTDFNNGLYEWGLGQRTDVYDPKSCTIIKDAQTNSKVLRVSFPQGTYGSSHGLSWKGELGAMYNELYLTYNIRLKDGFQYVKGGKLLGLAGGTFVVPAPPTGDQGFDALALWKPTGSTQCYVYHHASSTQYGEGGDWDAALSKFTPGVWSNITLRVVMNTVGQANGIYEAFVNGKMVFSSQHYEFRTTNNLGIHKITFISFFGGGDQTFATTRDEYIDYDNITVYRYLSGQGPVSGLNLSPAGSVISLPSGTTAPTNAEVSIKSFGSVANSVNCHFNLLINGVKISEQTVSTTETVYKFQTGMVASAISTVEVQFDNDIYVASTPPQDRNLKITGINIAGQDINLAGSNVIKPTNTTLSGTTLTMLSNGTLKVIK